MPVHGCKEKKETSSESSQSETKQSGDKKRRKQDQKDGRKYEENRGKTTNSGSGEIPEAEDSEELASYIKMTEYIRTQLERNRNTFPTDKPKYKREKKARHDIRKKAKGKLINSLPVGDGGDSRKLYLETEPLTQRVSEGLTIPPTVYKPISREKCESVHKRDLFASRGTRTSVGAETGSQP